MLQKISGLPKTFKIYIIEIPRGDMLLIQFLKVLTGLIIGLLTFNLFSFKKLLLGFLSFFCIVYFVYASNAIVDLRKDINHSVKKFRPLPAGKAKRNVVIFLVIINLFLALFLSFLVDINLFIIISLLAILCTVYNISSRHYLLESVIFFICSGILPFLYGFLLVSSSIVIPFVLYLFIQGLFYSTHIHLKDVPDVVVDKKFGQKSLVTILSINGLRKFISISEIFYIFLCILCIIIFKELYFAALLPNVFLFLKIHKCLKTNSYWEAYKNFLRITELTFISTAIIFYVATYEG